MKWQEHKSTKATEHHLGLLKAKIVKLKREQEENVAKNQA